MISDQNIGVCCNTISQIASYIPMYSVPFLPKFLSFTVHTDYGQMQE